jgi:sec-independent protein translocase protein TatC
MALDQVQDEINEKPMSFMGHIDELRKHIFRSAIVVVTFTIIAFIYVKTLFHQIILGPIREDFFTYRFLCFISDKLYEDSRLCMDAIHLQLVNLQVQGQFMAAFKISFITGFIVSFPYLIWEIWRFVKPALNKVEKQMAAGLVFACSLLFFTGILFGYYVLSPISINFFVAFQVSDLIANQPTFQNVISLISVLTIGTGLLFELPVLMYFLARVGLLSSSFLIKYRRYAFLFIIILAALVTPPDFVSQAILAIPIYLLYELGVSITKKVERNRAKTMEEN